VFCNLFLLQNKVLAAVLPDGMFSNQKSKFGHILEGLANEDVGIFSALLSILSILQQMLYFMAIWCIYLVVFWYIFSRFGMLYREKSGNPDWPLERRGKCKGNFTDRVNFVENAFKKQVCQ
jgi:hypothetical protein